MKFSLKLALVVLVVLALCLSLNGMLMIQKNHHDALAAFVTQNTQRHNRDVAQIERAVMDYLREYTAERQEITQTAGDTIVWERPVNVALARAADTVAAQLNENEGLCIRLVNSAAVYVAMPKQITHNVQIEALQLTADRYVLTETNDAFYMLLTTRLLVNDSEAYLVSAYDVTQLYQSRDNQLRSMTLFTALTLLVATALVIWLSRALTRPLRQLQTASESIAAGNYAERTQIRTNDEFNTVGQSFDQMAQAVEENVASLHRNLQAREDFISAFTHEIKTPATAMIGYASMLRAGVPDQDVQREAADYIWRETKRLEALSKKLLYLMQLDREKIEFEPVALGALFRELGRTLPTPAAGLTLDFSTPPGLAVYADRVLLDDLLRNLILNAQHACADGDRIEVSAVEDGDRVVLSVADTGCGMEQQELARLVEPFYMVDKSRARTQNGNGLGLTLAQRIAELHDTTLCIQSEKGTGTTVRFYLNKAKEVNADA